MQIYSLTTHEEIEKVILKNMEHKFLNWIKSYIIRRNDITHNFFIASHRKGYFNGVLSYIIENKNRTNPTTQPAFSLQTEYLIDMTEEAVYNKGIKRLNELFNDDFTIEEDKSNIYIKWD